MARFYFNDEASQSMQEYLKYVEDRPEYLLDGVDRRVKDVEVQVAAMKRARVSTSWNYKPTYSDGGLVKSRTEVDLEELEEPKETLLGLIVNKIKKSFGEVFRKEELDKEAILRELEEIQGIKLM